MEFRSFAAKLARAGETSIMLGVPAAPVWYVVDAIFWCCVLVQAVVLALETGRLFGHLTHTPQKEIGTT
jgi:hypothetical protein